MNACGKFVIVLAVAFLWASVIATTITFPLDFWLINPTARIRYGMWTLCQDLTTPNGGFLCYSFYDNYTQNSLTSYYKAFQGLQCGMLGFSTIALFLVLINLSFCYKFSSLFLIDSILVVLAICCAVVSLLIYGIKIYDPNTNIIGWCFWLSVGSGGLLVIALLLLTIYMMILGHVREKENKLKTARERENEAVNRYDFGTTKSIPSYRQASQQQQQVYTPDEPGSRYVVREAEYRNSNRWREPPPTTQSAYYPYDSTSYSQPNNTSANTINRSSLANNTNQNSNPGWTNYNESTASMSRYKIARSQV